MVWLAAAAFAMNTTSNILKSIADRESAWANMAALESEKTWNLGVMKQNKADVYARNVLSSYGSGINPFTGSTGAVISNNQQVLQDEIDFRRKQYDIQIGMARAQSKQKYLGLF